MHRVLGFEEPGSTPASGTPKRGEPVSCFLGFLATDTWGDGGESSLLLSVGEPAASPGGATPHRASPSDEEQPWCQPSVDQQHIKEQLLRGKAAALQREEGQPHKRRLENQMTQRIGQAQAARTTYIEANQSQTRNHVVDVLAGGANVIRHETPRGNGRMISSIPVVTKRGSDQILNPRAGKRRSPGGPQKPK